MVDPAADRRPVIVGIGEVTEKLDDLTQARDSLRLMADALRAADVDAGGGFLGKLDSLDIVRSRAWGYRDLPGQLCTHLGIAPQRVVLGPGGGDRPTYELHQAALAIANGLSEVAAVCGGESQWTVDRATRAKVALPWPADDRSTLPVRNRQTTLHPVAWKYGLHEPLHVYPLYENAVPRNWGLSPRAAWEESCSLAASFSAVATRNPYVWMKRAYTAEEIGTVSKDNRPLAWPYLKLMVAQASVNFGGAIILTSYGLARAMGVAESKLVFFHDGAAADEPKQYLQRDRYDRCPPAQEAVLRRLMRSERGVARQFDFVELYSCFPIVPKMAGRILELTPEQSPTVTGGLTFFGGPLNNYMTHATAAMVRCLRDRPGSEGLLYGQGGYLTNHHGLVLASRPPDRPLREDICVNVDAEVKRGPVPAIIDEYSGPARLETFTVLFSRTGEPERGVIIARARDGSRLMANVPANYTSAISFLLNPRESPVGTWGTCVVEANGLNTWRL